MHGLDVERMVDVHDNEFVISNPGTGAELQQDLRLISDLMIIIVSASVGAVILTVVHQPFITGYLITGSCVGPGVIGLIVELVQARSFLHFSYVHNECTF